MASEFYTIATDVTSGSVDVSTLRQEIIDDPIVPSSVYIVVRAGNPTDDLEINFSVVLNGTEKTALDAVVLNHPQIVEDSNAGAAGFNATRAPNANDDSTTGVQVGDTWIDSGQDIYVCLDNAAGAAQWSFQTQSGGGANEAPGRTCLGTVLDYPSAAGEGNAGDIQYSRIWLVAGTVIDRLEFFLDSQGNANREVRCGIYSQTDPLDEASNPITRVAQTNSVPTGPGLNGSFIQVWLTDAPTGGSGTNTAWTVQDTGWHWIAFIADNTVAKYAVSATFRANYLPVRRESGTGTTLPVTPSGLSNPVSAVILVCTIKEGVA